MADNGGNETQCWSNFRNPKADVEWWGSGEHDEPLAKSAISWYFYQLFIHQRKHTFTKSLSKRLSIRFHQQPRTTLPLTTQHRQPIATNVKVVMQWNSFWHALSKPIVLFQVCSGVSHDRAYAVQNVAWSVTRSAKTYSTPIVYKVRLSRLSNWSDSV